MLIKSSDDYSKLKKFVVALGKEIFPPQEDGTWLFLNSIKKLEDGPKSRAIEGLIMAANDILDLTSDWDYTRIKSCDEMLRTQGAFSLSEWHYRQLKTVSRIFSKGCIKNIKDYYIIKALIADGCFAPEEAKLAEELIYKFECK